MASLGVRKVIKLALVSRLIALLAQGVSNNLLADYDTSVEHPFCQPNTTNQQTGQQNTVMDQIISSALDGFSKWDAVYFLDIAQHGYQYEQNMAFFPLLPFSVYTFSLILTPLKLLLNLSDKSMLLLSAMSINTAAFVLAAVGLYKLTQIIFHNQKLAKQVAALFCFNPASVFFSAVYSESIFAMTQFWGMLFLEQDNRLASVLLFALGSAARSNGTTSCGFIGYKCLQEIILHYRVSVSKGDKMRPRAMALKFLKVTPFFFVIFLPFMLFQYYGYHLFCKTPQISPWCNALVPIPYSYIQKHYWNVGLLKYYELKQLPNFLLTLPVVVLSVLGIYEYLGRQNREDILSLGLLIKKSNSLNIFVYVCHLGFLLVFGVTLMHVQVVTRFVLSSSPMVYWIAVSWITPPGRGDNKIHSNLKANFVYVYFLVYYCLGFLLHCNFYPWT